jgi:hypothetical protein
VQDGKQGNRDTSGCRAPRRKGEQLSKIGFSSAMIRSHGREFRDTAWRHCPAHAQPALLIKDSKLERQRYGSLPHALAVTSAGTSTTLRRGCTSLDNEPGLAARLTGTVEARIRLA